VVFTVAKHGFHVLEAFTYDGSVQGHLQSQESWRVQMRPYADDNRPIAEIMTGFSDADMVYAANVNAVRDGDVWPVFTKWYWKQAGMRPEFRETNPGWTSYPFTNCFLSKG